MANIEVSGLYYYPIKSCAGTSAEVANLAETGLEYDRQWMLVDADSQFLSQRQTSQLALIKPRVTNDSLIVQAPNMPDLVVPLENEPTESRAHVPVTVFKKSGIGVSEGGDAADWFSDYIGGNTRLLRIHHARPVKPECRVAGGATDVAFADGFPILLTSEASLAELNSHLDQPVPMNRFRPNVVVRGEGLSAYDEDYWRDILIGNLSANVVRACARCQIPDTDQASGARPDRPVTAALRATRAGRDPIDNSPGNFFGQNVIHHLGVGQIQIGDRLTVVSRASERNFIPKVLRTI